MQGAARRPVLIAFGMVARARRHRTLSRSAWSPPREGIARYRARHGRPRAKTSRVVALDAVARARRHRALSRLAAAWLPPFRVTCRPLACMRSQSASARGAGLRLQTPRIRAHPPDESFGSCRHRPLPRAPGAGLVRNIPACARCWPYRSDASLGGCPQMTVWRRQQGVPRARYVARQRIFAAPPRNGTARRCRRGAAMSTRTQTASPWRRSCVLGFERVDCVQFQSR